MATEVAYYTYIYAKVPTEYFQQVSSHTRAAILAGRALSSIFAQILITFEIMDYKQLNYISLGGKFSYLISSVKIFILNYKER